MDYKTASKEELLAEYKRLMQKADCHPIGSKKEFLALPDVLNHGETVDVAIEGTAKKGISLVVLTNQRLLILHKGLFSGLDVISLSLAEIESVSVKSTFLGTDVTINTICENHKIAIAGKIGEYLADHVNGATQKNNPEAKLTEEDAYIQEIDKLIEEAEKIIQENAPPPTIKTIQSRSHKSKQDSEEFIELEMADIDGYESPSGGFLTYAQFRVKGVSLKTGRKNTVRVNARNPEEAQVIAESKGIVGPYDEIMPEPFDEPTEPQIAFATSLGLAILDGACKKDVSAMLSRMEDDDREPPSSGLCSWAIDCGVDFSRFIGRQAMIRHLVYSLNEVDLATFYAYCVCVQDDQGELDDPRDYWRYDDIREWAENVALDSTLLDSLKGRDECDFERPHKGTKIYKSVIKHLKA